MSRFRNIFSFLNIGIVPEHWTWFILPVILAIESIFLCGTICLWRGGVNRFFEITCWRPFRKNRAALYIRVVSRSRRWRQIKSIHWKVINLLLPVLTILLGRACRASKEFILKVSIFTVFPVDLLRQIFHIH